jgi:hypothetical protein
MFNQETTVTEAREIYRINNILRSYKVNFYYSLRKDAIFLFEGRSVKERIITAYTLTAIGGILFILSVVFHDVFFTSNWIYLTYSIASLSFVSGIYILTDFYQKIKYNKTKTLITRNGISFREKDLIELWSAEKIKNLEMVFLARKKEVMKPGFDESKLKKKAKILIYNRIGKTKTLLELNHTDRQTLRDDLEEITSFVKKFSLQNQVDMEFTDENSNKKFPHLHSTINE